MQRLIKTAALLLFLPCFSCQKQTPIDKIPLIIDADTANEVDDLYAIVRALQAPELNVLGINSAQFHTSPLASDTTVFESQHINQKILELMNRKDIPLPLGSNIPISDPLVPATSEASTFIIKEAHKMPSDKKLQIAILGPCTNVASAILQDPTIIPKIQVHYIGFWHDTATNLYDKNEFNSRNDALAVNVLLDTDGLDFNVMTATTCQHLVFDKSEVDQNLNGNVGIGNYLIERWENYERWWTKEDPEKKHWIMWDLAIIEALIHPEMVEKKPFSTPEENTKRNIGIYTDIDVEAMKTDFWQSLYDL